MLKQVIGYMIAKAHSKVSRDNKYACKNDNSIPSFEILQIMKLFTFVAGDIGQQKLIKLALY